MREEWREVLGYEGKYEVSNLGNVRTPRVPIMKLDADRYGYKKIGLWKNAKCKKFLVHRLVAAAFIGPRPRKATVNHKNGEKADNRSENLEYLTQGANAQHSFDELGRTSPGGSRHWNHKLTETDVADIIALRPSNSLLELAR